MTKKFDNSKPNIVLISDNVEEFSMPKTIGVFKIARELRLAGYQVAVLHHAHVFSIDEIKNIISHLVSNKTLYVGVNNFFYNTDRGSMLPQGIDYNQEIKALIQTINADCKFVLGGPNAKDTVDNKDFDYVVLGYADISAVNLADHLLKGDKLNHAYRSIYGFTIIADSKADGFDFVHRKMDYEDYDCIMPGETLPIEISRGCIFKCKFCNFPLNGKNKLDYIKDGEVLYQEFIDNYTRFNVTRYILLDDTFNDSVDKVKMMYDISKRLPFTLEYWAYVRLDLLAAHPETIDLIFESGLRSAFFGIESFNEKSASAISKGIHKDKLFKTIKQIKDRWGDEVMLGGNFICGLPHESVESFLEGVELLKSGATGLDAYNFLPLRLDQIDSNNTGFFSELSLNPEKFGYRNLRPLPKNKEGTHVLYWENDYMNFHLAEKLVEQNNPTSGPIMGQQVFNIAGLGVGLDYARNQPYNTFDWRRTTLLKLKRIKEYKTLFYKMFDISVDK